MEIARVRCELAFALSADSRILATLHIPQKRGCSTSCDFSLTAFDDEDEFLRGAVLAALSDEETVAVVSRVLMTISGRPHCEPWLQLNASPAQLASMGLRLPRRLALDDSDAAGLLASVDLKAALEQTPIPLCLMEGPEHTISFINDSYIELIGRESPEAVLGLSMSDAVDELRGQPFFTWLDRVYRRGEPYVGVEVPARLFSRVTQQLEDRFINFVYHPIRDRNGEVCGVLSQATNVTESVLDQQVREERENRLYRQWAELDTLYRVSPLGMSLVRASDLTIERVNEQNAKLVKRHPDELVGLCIADLYPQGHFVLELMHRVIRDKRSHSVQIDTEVPGEPGSRRRLHWSLSPVLDGTGEVESIASTVVELEESSSPEYVDPSVYRTGEFTGG